MLLLTHTIKEAWRGKKIASVLFLDVQGAFPNVVKEVLLHNMRTRGVPPEYIKVTELILTGRRTKLSFDDFISEFIAINNGNNQGCPLSMLYYAFYNAGLLDISPPHAPDEKQFGFVDDVALLATGDNFTETYAKLTDMMNRPNGAFDWSTSHNSQFELSKLALINFSPKSLHDVPLTLTHLPSPRTTTIKPTTSYKFLGILFDPKLKWKAQTEKAARSAEAWINLVRRLARTSTGISAKGMRQLYTAIAVPKMAYAAEVWYTLPHYPNETSKKRLGSVRFTQKLVSAQRRATITMLGAMRTTAGDVLNAHASLPPPHLLFLKTITRAATRLAALPDNHPLHKPAKQALNKPVKRHHSPLHLLFLTTGMKPKDYERILPARRRRNYNPLANITIEDNRTTAIEQANELTGTILFTDGSGHDHGIGAGAIMVRNGTVVRTRRYCLGSDENHTVYEAEALAITLALHLAVNMDRMLTELTIGTDNQAVLLGLLNQRTKPSHHLLDRIHDSLEDFQVSQARMRGIPIKGYRKGTGRTKLQDGSKGWKEWKLKQWCRVNFIWTPGHEGIPGNERADDEAKAAAEGNSSTSEDLPPYLRRKPLPISIAATRQNLKQRIKQRWIDEWTKSPRAARLLKIDKKLPSNDYLHIIDQLRRNQASVLTQLRTGHIPLNTVLHRIKKTNSPDCPHCGNGYKETVFHLLLTCPHYNNARRVLQSKLRSKASSIAFLLGTRTGIPHLLRFISDTNRLKATFGEVRPEDNFTLKPKPIKDTPPPPTNEET
jgi:ribonuclease HI